jgi:cell division protein FtsL
MADQGTDLFEGLNMSLNMKRLPPNHTNLKVHREHDLSALSRLLLLLLCGLALTGGFLFAANQHFAAIQYGYKSEELRREHERLLEEQRRLLLVKEEASSPARLESAARGIGLQRVEPGQIAANSDEKRTASHPAGVMSSAAALSR